MLSHLLFSYLKHGTQHPTLSLWSSILWKIAPGSAPGELLILRPRGTVHVQALMACKCVFQNEMERAKRSLFLSGQGSFGPGKSTFPARAQPSVTDFFRRVRKWLQCLCASKLCLHKRTVKTLNSAALLVVLELLEVRFLTFVLL